MRERLRESLSQTSEKEVDRAILGLTGGDSLEDWLTREVISSQSSSLMSYRDFTEHLRRDGLQDDGEFLSQWLVLSRETLENLVRLLVRDGIGMTHNLDHIRGIVKALNLGPTYSSQAPEKYRVEEDGTSRTIWDDEEGIGLRFTKGERLSRHLAEIVLKDSDRMSTEEGMRILEEVHRRLLSFAEERFPEEFKTEVR